MGDDPFCHPPFILAQWGVPPPPLLHKGPPKRGGRGVNSGRLGMKGYKNFLTPRPTMPWAPFPSFLRAVECRLPLPHANTWPIRFSLKGDWTLKILLCVITGKQTRKVQTQCLFLLPKARPKPHSDAFCFVFNKSSRQQNKKEARTNYLTVPKTVIVYLIVYKALLPSQRSKI